MAVSESQLIEKFNELIRESKEKLDSDPENAAKLCGLGFYLFSLSNVVDPQEATVIAKDAISKLEKALQINTEGHDAWKLLGSALMFYVSLNLAKDEALIYLQKTVDYFQEALDKNPRNRLYLYSLTSASLKLAAYSNEAVCKVPGNEHYLKFLKASTQDPGKTSNTCDPKSSVDSTLNSKIIGNGPYGKYVWSALSVAAVVWIGTGILSKRGF